MAAVRGRALAKNAVRNSASRRDASQAIWVLIAERRSSSAASSGVTALTDVTRVRTLGLTLRGAMVSVHAWPAAGGDEGRAARESPLRAREHVLSYLFSLLGALSRNSRAQQPVAPPVRVRAPRCQ